MTAATDHEAAFRAQTGKRKAEAFQEDGAWWVLDADGHQWCLVDGEWQRFTDDDDWYVLELRRAKRAPKSPWNNRR